MKGGHVTDLLLGYREGTLSFEQRERIKTHLIFCRPCRQEFENPSPPPLRPASERQTASSKKIPQLSFAAYGALTALSLILIGGVLKFALRSQPDAPPPAPTIVPTPTPVPVSTPLPVVPVVVATPVVRTVKSLGPFTELRGDVSKLHEPMTGVIDQPLKWGEFWKKHEGEAALPPEVDFGNFDVLVIFPGYKSTKGYNIQIDQIQQTSWEGKSARIVHYRISSPQGVPTGSATHPFLIVKVPKLAGDTFFRLHP